MKTDNYLALCVEQAALSPLHYRHGCIIVRGGKVIGQGYNDYRPGYDGGALKHGRIASGGLDVPAIAELKRKRKFKTKSDLKSMDSKNGFIQFEGMGGGPYANLPLSMHSEMMAIHSALACSSTMAATVVSYEKPCFKLPGGGKRKARLRNDALKAYVERAFAAAEENERRSGNAQDDGWYFEAGASQPDQAQQGSVGGGVGGGRGRGGASVEKYGETPHEEEELESSRSEEGSVSSSSSRSVSVRACWTTSATTGVTTGVTTGA
jgi:deoxycytidylate deaminase